MDDNYKWVTRDCKEQNAYVCQRMESGSVWIAANQTPNEWLQVDLGSIMKISGIMTQGAPEEDAWVTSYEMSYSDKGRDLWFDYLNHDGSDTVKFRGNSDRRTISEGLLRQPISARFIKIKP